MGNPSEGEKSAEQAQWAASWKGPDGYSWEVDPMSENERLGEPEYREFQGFHELSGDVGGFMRDSQTSTGNSWDLEDGWQAASGWGAGEL